MASNKEDVFYTHLFDAKLDSLWLYTDSWEAYTCIAGDIPRSELATTGDLPGNRIYRYTRVVMFNNQISLFTYDELGNYLVFPNAASIFSLFICFSMPPMPEVTWGLESNSIAATWPSTWKLF